MAVILDPIFTGMANGPEAIDKNFKSLVNSINNPVAQYTGTNGNLNDLVTNGIYTFEGWSGSSAPVKNCNGGILQVVGDNAYNAVQIFSYANSKEYFYRRCWGTSRTWTDWSKIGTEDTYIADSANGYGSWYGEVHYRRVGRVCTARFNLKGGNKPTSGNMVSIPDWAVPLNGTVEVAGETTDLNVTKLMFANARIDGPSKKLVTSWIPGNIFIAAMTYVCK